MKTLAAGLSLALMLCGIAAYADGTLYIASESEEFQLNPGDPFFEDRFAIATTSGTTINTYNIVSTGENPISALAEGGGFLFGGDPFSNQLRRFNYSGGLISSITADFPSECCNSEMITNGVDFYRAFYDPDAGFIQRLDPNTGDALQTYAQNDTVGMTYVGSDIWITHWQQREVGIWDPLLNTFTPVFSTDDANAGGLAYDPTSGVLWVGTLGGELRPYTLTGTLLDGAFFPFDNVADTITGLDFVPAQTEVPEPGTFAFLLGLGVAGANFLRRRRSS